ncbi:MAG: hypothetical protein M5R36_10225 [Deltaproteobacteria bacterium]|nr:hypothetical protein [Deltaproteobacteria bacterium]
MLISMAMPPSDAGAQNRADEVAIRLNVEAAIEVEAVAAHHVEVAEDVEAAVPDHRQHLGEVKLGHLVNSAVVEEAVVEDHAVLDPVQRPNNVVVRVGVQDGLYLVHEAVRLAHLDAGADGERRERGAARLQVGPVGVRFVVAVAEVQWVAVKVVGEADLWHGDGDGLAAHLGHAGFAVA